MEVSITTTGQVKSIDIVRSSGHKLLDDAAINIVKLSEPFDPLPPEIQKNTDLFVIYRVWNFEIDGLNTSK